MDTLDESLVSQSHRVASIQSEVNAIDIKVKDLNTTISAHKDFKRKTETTLSRIESRVSSDQRPKAVKKAASTAVEAEVATVASALKKDLASALSAHVTSLGQTAADCIENLTLTESTLEEKMLSERVNAKKVHERNVNHSKTNALAVINDAVSSATNTVTTVLAKKSSETLANADKNINRKIATMEKNVERRVASITAEVNMCITNGKQSLASKKVHAEDLQTVATNALCNIAVATTSAKAEPELYSMSTKADLDLYFTTHERSQ